MEVYRNALLKMSNIFTSHDFTSALRLLGFTDATIKRGDHIKFLEDNCIQMSGKTWAKFAAVTVVETDYQKSEKEVIDQYVAFLKSRGYKILKPGFVEL